MSSIPYAFTQLISSLVIAIISMDHLKQNVALARNFTAMPEGERTVLLDRVREAAGNGRYELFKTTQVLDYITALAPASAIIYRGIALTELHSHSFIGDLRAACLIRVVLDSRRVLWQER
jgi:hypothetical protein